MTDLLQGLPLGQVSAGVLVGIIVIAILQGRLVPRQQLLDVMADRDAWRASAESSEKTALTLGMSMEKLLVLAEATNHALTEIQQLTSEVRRARTDGSGPTA